MPQREENAHSSMVYTIPHRKITVYESIVFIADKHFDARKHTKSINSLRGMVRQKAFWTLAPPTRHGSTRELTSST